MYLLQPESTLGPKTQARHEVESRNYWMLADRLRSQRLQAAVFKTVRPGDVVLDVGTGTGLLSMSAVQAGAARVYVVEHWPGDGGAGARGHRAQRHGRPDHGDRGLGRRG